MRLDAFRIAGGRVGFTDNSVEPAAVVDFQDLELGVTGISNEAEAVFPVELSGALAAGGGFRFDGQVTALPALTASGTATVHEIPLPLAQPYVQQGLRIQLEEGVLDSTTDVTVLQGGAACGPPTRAETNPWCNGRPCTSIDSRRIGPPAPWGCRPSGSTSLSRGWSSTRT
jgi:hypothetical protein